jgi:hypothetical protein
MKYTNSIDQYRNQTAFNVLENRQGSNSIDSNVWSREGPRPIRSRAGADTARVARGGERGGIICSTKGPSLAMAAVSGMFFHLPRNGPVMIEVDLSKRCVYE